MTNLEPVKSYLSIDLDYWNEDDGEEALSPFFEEVFRLNLPIFVVESHDVLLKKINPSKARILYNIDFHSDFVGYMSEEECVIELGEDPIDSNWVNYVKWRSEGEYVWIHPYEECFHDESRFMDSCQEGSGACWGCQKNNPFSGAYHDWKIVRHYTGIKQIKWKTICGIGISLSQDYLLGNHKPFDSLVTRLEVKERFYRTLADRYCFDSKWCKMVQPPF